MLFVRLSKDEKKQLERLAPETGPKTVYRMRLKRGDFIEKGFTDGCLGCKAILEGSGARGHTEVCRTRMEAIMRNTSEGQDRLKRQQDRENEHLSRLLEPHDPYSHIHKRAKTDTRDDSEGDARSTPRPTGRSTAMRATTSVTPREGDQRETWRSRD